MLVLRVQIVAAAEDDVEAAAQFDGDVSAAQRKTGEGPKPVVTPITPGEEAIWKEYAACFRRQNNKRG